MTAMHSVFRAATAAVSLARTAWPLVLGLLVLAAAPAQAQQPMAKPSVDALVNALAGGPATRAFRRTQLPDAASNLCEGQRAVLAGARESTSRNLEVVPYAGDTTPGVNLSVQFATASDRLMPADRALLDTLASALNSAALAQDRFAVAGHTDATGDARINLELSCARAVAVRVYLATRGVDVKRLSAYGFGANRLLAADEPAGAVNRRVEIRKAPE
jgi:outer membrane protein OmpA-like peptidoglycan-associated protein